MLKTKAYLFATAVVVMFAISPVQADEKQTPQSDIHVQTCSAQKGRPAYTETYTDSDGKTRTRRVAEEDSYLKLYFRNTSPHVMREVDFGLVARDKLIDKVKDVGTFSPGVLIEHKFKVSRDIFPLRTALPYCAVLRVRYEDGRVWTNPNPPNE